MTRWCAWAYSRASSTGTVELAPRQGIVVPKGVQHRPRAPGRTLGLMVEAATVTPTGDAGGSIFCNIFYAEEE